MMPDEIVQLIKSCTHDRLVHRGLHLHTDESGVSLRAQMIGSVFALLVSLADVWTDPMLDL